MERRNSIRVGQVGKESEIKTIVSKKPPPIFLVKCQGQTTLTQPEYLPSFQLTPNNEKNKIQQAHDHFVFWHLIFSLSFGAANHLELVKISPRTMEVWAHFHDREPGYFRSFLTSQRYGMMWLIVKKLLDIEQQEQGRQRRIVVERSAGWIDCWFSPAKSKGDVDEFLSNFFHGLADSSGSKSDISVS